MNFFPKVMLLYNIYTKILELYQINIYFINYSDIETCLII